MTTPLLPVQMFPMPEDSAYNFSKLGSQFLDSARFLFEKEKFAPYFPAYALVGQAIELHLKAYLRGTGRKVNELKSIGHNLKLALETAEKHGLSKCFTVNADDRKCLEKLSLVYQSKDFQYRSQGAWDLPFPHWTIDFADRLSKCVSN